MANHPLTSPLEITPPPVQSGTVPSALGAPRQPSRLYRALWWRLGMLAASSCPRTLAVPIASTLGRAYAQAAPRRLETVRRNLLPVVDYDEARATRQAQALFGEFAVKLVDLWRYETGRPHFFHALEGWEHFERAQARNQGVLLLTIHMGNWEFGAPLLTQRGVPLHIITQAEPDAPLGKLRETARARWGVRTLTLSEDPFGMVNVIRHLQANETVALLMDRPPTATAVEVRLCGRPFAASVAAAELARATGCALLPVCLPRTASGYLAQILPEIPYDRARLRQGDERLQLTQRILSAFEPFIRLYLSQWYHFVPIWGDSSGCSS